MNLLCLLVLYHKEQYVMTTAMCIVFQCIFIVTGNATCAMESLVNVLCAEKKKRLFENW